MIISEMRQVTLSRCFRLGREGGGAILDYKFVVYLALVVVL